MTTGLEPQVTTTKLNAFILVVAAAFVCLGLLSHGRIEDRFNDVAQDEGRSTLRLVSGTVNQAVGRYKPIPGLIARDPLLRDLLREPDNTGVVPYVSEKLRLTAFSTEAREIFLTDSSGAKVASSNYLTGFSESEGAFDHRQYFERSVNDKIDWFQAAQTASGERIMFFAAPVLNSIDVLGLVVLSVNVNDLEGTWAGAARDVMITDEDGLVFMSSRPEFRLSNIAALLSNDPDTSPISDELDGTVLDGPEVIVSESNELVVREGLREMRYLSASGKLDLAGWKAVVLTPLKPVEAKAGLTLAVWCLVVAAIAFALLAIVQRRARLFERDRLNKAQRVRLENEVRARTKDLNGANMNLRTEIEERKQTEEQLRKTQKELIQTGKMAALGQMSAALSHEINQPLAAVKSYADNAAQYLQRNRTKEAAENIERISEMTDRMAKISGHLRNFARRPKTELRAIPIADAINEALALTEPHARKNGTDLIFHTPRTEIWGLGGRLRLQQVLVNVVTNAIEAMANSAVRLVEIEAEVCDEQIEIRVRDHGPGILPEIKDQLFEPFASARASGDGMGLGLTIASNIVADFGGSLRGENHAKCGAVFTIVLKTAKQDSQPVHTLVAE